MPPTQKDIAREAGVSITAVSLALRNHPRISAETRDRILGIAADLGYRTNPMVAALMPQIRSGRTEGPGAVIGLIGPSGMRAHIMNSPFPYSRRLQEGIRARSEELGFKLDWFESENEDGNVRSAARVARVRGVRGLLIPPVAREGTRMEADWSEFSVVAIGRSHTTPGLHHVAHNLHEAGQVLTRACISRGYRRIGLHLQRQYDRRTGNLYVGSFLSTLADHGTQTVSSKWICNEVSIAGRGWIDWIRQQRIDCLITQFPDAISRLRTAGFNVPDDLGVCFLSIDDKDEERSGIHQDPFTLGKAAVDLLTAHLNRNEYGLPDSPKTVLTAPIWREGKTLRPVPLPSKRPRRS